MVRHLLDVMVVLAVIVTPAMPSDVMTRVIEREVYFHQPLGHCEIPNVIRSLAKAVQVPAGIEHLPEDCLLPITAADMPSTPPRERVFLTGKSVRDALDMLVAADPRYRWAEDRGVIVVRPVSAWANREHFLNRTLPAYSSVDQHLSAALDEWRLAMRSDANRRPSEVGRAGQRTEEGNRPFTATVEADSSAILVLDHIVRSHGRSLWQVRYCQPAAEERFATVFMWTLEDAPTGVGVPLNGRLATIEGKRVDVCAGRM
jgi:hypothetical protein